MPVSDENAPETVETAEADEAEGTAVVGASEADPVDFGFYSMFWGLQQAFASPADAVAAHKWSEIANQLTSVLQAASSQYPVFKWSEIAT